jgi:hypothetical protein
MIIHKYLSLNQYIYKIPFIELFKSITYIDGLVINQKEKRATLLNITQQTNTSYDRPWHLQTLKLRGLNRTFT